MNHQGKLGQELKARTHGGMLLAGLLTHRLMLNYHSSWAQLVELGY